MRSKLFFMTAENSESIENYLLLLYTICMDDKALQTTITENPLDNPTGVLLLDKFPPHPGAGRPFGYTPANVIEALRLWTTNTLALDDCLVACTVEVRSYYRLRSVFPEIVQAEDHGRKLKALQWVKKALEPYKARPQDIDYMYEQDKQGNPRMSQAAVTYARDRSRIYMQMAAQADPSRYSDVQRTESKSISVSLSHQASTGKELADTIHDLLGE